MLRRLMLFAAVLSLCLAGCEPHAGKVSENGVAYRVRKIDGCEYIEVDSGFANSHVYALTHKGNCSNPAHQCRCPEASP